MQYAILVYETKADFAQRDTPPGSPYWSAYMAYADALTKAGVMRGGEALQPPSLATTVRLRSGRRDVQDGPFIDSKEQLGGMFVIEAATLDEALAWAARCPAAATGCAEVRPILPMAGDAPRP